MKIKLLCDLPVGDERGEGSTMTQGLNWVDHAKAGALAEAICSYVREYDWVSFPELQRKMEPYFVTRGQWEMDMGTDTNVVLWQGLSEPMVDVLQQLVADNRLVLESASPFTYIVDGAALRLPIAKRPPAAGYKQPHWAPVCFRAAPA